MTGPQLFVIAFGAVLAAVGIALFAVFRFRGAEAARNKIEILNIKFELSHPSLVIFALGCVLIIVPFSTGSNTQEDGPTPRIGARTDAPEEVGPATPATRSPTPTAVAAEAPQRTEATMPTLTGSYSGNWNYEFGQLGLFELNLSRAGEVIDGTLTLTPSIFVTAPLCGSLVGDELSFSIWFRGADQEQYNVFFTGTVGADGGLNGRFVETNLGVLSQLRGDCV